MPLGGAGRSGGGLLRARARQSGQWPCTWLHMYVHRCILLPSICKSFTLLHPSVSSSSPRLVNPSARLFSLHLQNPPPPPHSSPVLVSLSVFVKFTSRTQNAHLLTRLLPSSDSPRFAFWCRKTVWYLMAAGILV